jgi:ADP-ribosylglycohydrolase
MDKALGCIIGALVGDACGAPQEFQYDIKDEDIENAIYMKGGGMLNVGRGQITDDGELTLALAGALTNTKYYSYERAATAYSNWINSDPFDIGTTCRKAFTVFDFDTPNAMLYNAAKYNMLSESNGAAMRITPIPIKFRNESDDVITQIAKYDAMLSHPNQICLDVNAIFALTLAHLIKHDNTRKVFDHISDYIQTNITSKVKDWFLHDRYDYLDRQVHMTKRNIGHVKHAFCMGMNLLESPMDYESGIRYVLKMGGDTDTNAACCGGILGAIHGYTNIPIYMRNPVLNYKYSSQDLIGYDRPYKASSAIEFVQNIYT